MQSRFPRIPVPPSSSQRNGGGGEHSILPPLSSRGAGSGITTARKSLRLLDDLRAAAELLELDIGERSARTSSNNHNTTAMAKRKQLHFHHRVPLMPSSTTNKENVVDVVVPSSSRSTLLLSKVASSSSTASVSKAILASQRTPRTTASGGSGNGVVSGSSSSSGGIMADPIGSLLAASQSQSHQQRLAAMKPPSSSSTQQQQPLTSRVHSTGGVVAPSQPQTTRASTTAIPSSSLASRPLSPTSALRIYGPQLLTAYEMQELRKYSKIYFAGSELRRKVNPQPIGGISGNSTTATTSSSSSSALPSIDKNNNKASSSEQLQFHPNAFGDDSCNYRIVLNDHVAFRYEVLSRLGSGSFGQVVKCLDHKTGENVALKIIKNKRKFHEQALVERNILEYVNSGHRGSSEIFVNLRDSFLFRGHVVFVFDLHGLSLYDRMKATGFAQTPMALIQAYAQQLLECLKFMRGGGPSSSNSIIHCDIKPENILCARDDISRIRLIDFGSSCFQNQRVHTYIQSRFYRAPEIVFGIPYTPVIDMWSLGAMLFELRTGQPLFPAQSESELLGMITSRLGPPPAQLLERAPRRKHFYDPNTGALKKNSKASSSSSRYGPVGSALCCSDEQELVSLINQMLQWDPMQRITPEEALAHPFFQKNFGKPIVAPSAPKRKNKYRI